METTAETAARRRPLASSLFLSTGVKMFFILTLALLPLGLVALFASIQAIRTADAEREALLRVAAAQSARKLTTEISSDQAALRLTVNTLAAGQRDASLCARTDAFMHSRSGDDARFAIYDRQGHRLCASRGLTQDGVDPGKRFATANAEILPERGALLVRTGSANGRMMAIALYDRAYLDRVTEPTYAGNHHVALMQDGKKLDVSGPPPAPGQAVSSVSARIEPTDIQLKLMVRDPSRAASRSLSLFLPMLMWLAAAGIGWLVVNRLLISPLVQLRRAVAGYQPGEVLEPLGHVRTPAQEIRDLGNTFRAITEDVATHEAEMADGLERQRKLTREVHHRVKNNLQIIASLINLHSRSAATPEAGEAYGSIQRRVDALSVVHRNHYYAELEENRGVGLRALISELSASLRASASDPAHAVVIQVDSDHLHVNQDVAVAVAFLITELVELAMLSASQAVVRIVLRSADPGQAELRVESAALRPSPAMQAYLDGRFQRVLTGLSRQLRAPLNRDEAAGAFSILIGILD